MKSIALCFSILFSFSICGYAQNPDQWLMSKKNNCLVWESNVVEDVIIEWDGPCSNGKAHGKGKLSRYRQGNLESTFEGEYVNGVRTGKGKSFMTDGSSLEGNYINGKIVGFGVQFDAKGNQYEGQFIHQRKHGNGTLTFKNGEKQDGFYVCDRFYSGRTIDNKGKITLQHQNYPIKKLPSEKPYSFPVIGQKTVEYFNKNLELCAANEAKIYREISYEKKFTPIGEIKEFYIDGGLYAKYHALYVDPTDRKKTFYEGEVLRYFSNGQLMEKSFFYHGSLHGEQLKYNQQGQLISEIHYQFGNLNGTFKTFFDNGQPHIIAEYQHGDLKNNCYKEFFEDKRGAMVYWENFYSPIWSGASETSIYYPISEHLLMITSLQPLKNIRCNDFDILPTSNYSCEVTISIQSGKLKEGTGIFIAKDSKNLIEFLIKEDQKFLVKGLNDGRNVHFVSEEKSKLIDINKKNISLEIKKENDLFYFFINHSLVGSCSARQINGSTMGFVSYDKGTFWLENLKVKELMSESELIQKKPKEKWTGNGTGFFISEKGYIATNYHVVQNSRNIQVEYLVKGVKKSFPAKIEVYDKVNDIAILRIIHPEFTPLAKIPYSIQMVKTDIGSDVFTLGYPIADIMGEKIKFTDGKLSSLSGYMDDSTIFQISVPIQHGNSGGPLFDQKGNIIGITSSGLNKQIFDSENVNYAVKTIYLKRLLEKLPEKINLPTNSENAIKSTKEKINLFSDYITIIKTN